MDKYEESKQLIDKLEKEADNEGRTLLIIDNANGTFDDDSHYFNYIHLKEKFKNVSVVFIADLKNEIAF